jgi:hypothetical protein
MRGTLLLGALLGALLLNPRGGRSQERPAPIPAAKLVPPIVYYATYPDFEKKVRVSDEMAAKLVEIVSRKAEPFQRTLRVLPRGYFMIGGKAYSFYGFLTSDPERGRSWDDPALGKFWDELNRVEYTVGLGPLRDFKP